MSELSPQNVALMKRFIGQDNWRHGDFLWSDVANGALDAARAEGAANLSKVMEENARLTAGIAQIERMRLFPDDKINRTTLQAAIHIARSLLSREG